MTQTECPKFMLIQGKGLCKLNLQRRQNSDGCDFEGCPYVAELQADNPIISGIRTETVHLIPRPILIYEDSQE